MSLALSACAIGHEYDYQKVQTNFDSKTDKSITAGVVDQRPYVLNDEKAPTFVGLQRAGFGIPYNVTTKSGEPLAKELTNAVVQALERQSAEVTALVLPPGASRESALERFRQHQTERLLLIAMKQWKTDSMMRVTLHWDLAASVYDKTGSVLARHSVSGVEPVGSAGFETGNSNTATQQIAQKLGDLLNHPDIVAALN